MLRFGYLLIVGTFVAGSLFACGDKINPKGTAPTAEGGTPGEGGTTGAGGTTDVGGIDGSVSEAGVSEAGVSTGGASGTGGTTTVAGVSYKNTIAPMMTKSCATSKTCHSAGNPWSVDLDTYAGVKANAAASIASIKGGSMPPSGTFPAADLKNLQDWVTAGSPNN